MAFNPNTGQSIVADALLRSALFGNQPRGRFPVVAPSQNIGRFLQAFASQGIRQNEEEERQARNQRFGEAIRDLGATSDITEEQAKLLENPDIAAIAAPQLFQSIFAQREQPGTTTRFLNREGIKEFGDLGAATGFGTFDADGNLVAFKPAAELDEDDDQPSATGGNIRLNQTIAGLGNAGDTIIGFRDTGGNLFGTSREGARIPIGSDQGSLVSQQETGGFGQAGTAPGKGFATDALKRSNANAQIISEALATNKVIAQNPRAAGGPGAAIVGGGRTLAAFADVAGLGAQARQGLDIVSKRLTGLTAEEQARVATDSRRAITNFVPFISSDSSRFSDQDVAFAERVVGRALAFGDPQEMVAAHQRLTEMIIMRQYQFFLRNENLVSGLPKPLINPANVEDTTVTLIKQGYPDEVAFEFAENLRDQIPFYSSAQPFDPRARQ